MCPMMCGLHVCTGDTESGCQHVMSTEGSVRTLEDFACVFVSLGGHADVMCGHR